MGIVKLSTAGILDYQKYSSVLAGNAAFSPGSFDLLETQVLSSSASSVTFTGLGSYTDYKHLQLRMTGRFSNTAQSQPIDISLNSDTGSNYASHFLSTYQGNVNSEARTSQARVREIAHFPANSAPSNAFGGTVIDLLDFNSTSKYKTLRSLTGFEAADSNGKGIIFGSGLWMSTSAVTSITLEGYFGTGNFVSGSRFSLMGAK